MKAGCAANRQCGAAEHALEAAHQVVMTDQAKVAALVKSDAYFVKRHAVASHSGPRGSFSAGNGKANIVGLSGRHRRSGSARLRRTTWVKGNCKLRIANCELQIGEQHGLN